MNRTEAAAHNFLTTYGRYRDSLPPELEAFRRFGNQSRFTLWLMESSNNPEERQFAVLKGRELDAKLLVTHPEIDKPAERTREKPVWNRDSLTLTIDGVACRSFRRAKGNDQLKILDAFQEKDWPEAINDPFKDEFKLKETIKSFNRLSKNAANSDRVFRNPAWPNENRVVLWEAIRRTSPRPC